MTGFIRIPEFYVYMKPVIGILKSVYAVWSLLVFSSTYVLLFPFFWLIVLNKKRWHAYTGTVNKIWAYLVYSLIAMPMRTEYRAKFSKKKTYIFCPNHTSYLDIPIVGFSAPHFVMFVGKSSLNKIPLFGYMFRNLHIPVNRQSITQSYRTFEKAKAALDQGHSLLIFPEGGINDHNVPDVKNLKDGAFRLAIEKQIPIVPVTIPYNWIILHDDVVQMTWHPSKIIYHEPIETQGMTLQDVGALKQKLRETIREEMARHFPGQITLAHQVQGNS